MREADRGIVYSIPLPAAAVGTLSARSSDSVGTLTITNHSLGAGDTIDIYWGSSVRYGATVGVVSGDDVPISGGAGVALPAESSSVVVGQQRTINTRFKGDRLDFFLLSYSGFGAGHCDFGSAQVTLSSVDDFELFDVSNGEASPFAGLTITQCKASSSLVGDTTKLCIVAVEMTATGNTIDAREFAFTGDGGEVFTDDNVAILRGDG